jgi:CubicO group peptidase (beta-lactamase class C family)
VTAPAPGSAELSPNEVQKLEGLFARFDRPDRPGCAIAVIRGGETVWLRCYGLANVENGVPVTPETVFRIGSVTKHLLATLVLLLEDRGLLKLDDPAKKHLPELPVCMQAITLRHLLTMSGGLPDGVALSIFAGRGERPLSRDEHFGLALRTRELMFAPGSAMLYSNTNYLLLSVIVERLTGRSLEEVMRTELFEPLGMTSARLEVRALEVGPSKAKGYVPSGGDGQFIEGIMLYDASGDGGVDMSISDLAIWLKAYRGEALIGAGYRARMEAEFRFPDGQLSDYRLGLNVDAQHGFLRVGHAGGMSGYLADLSLFPGSDIGVVMLTNLMDVTLLDAGDDVVEALTGASRALSRAGPTEGFYLDPKAGMAMQIGRDGSGTAICYMMGDRARLIGDPTRGWTPAKRGVGYRIEPVDDEDTLTVRFGAGPPQRFTRWSAPPSPQSPAEFVGAYRSQAVGETHYVRLAPSGGLEVSLDSGLRSLAWKALEHRAQDVFTAPLPSEPSASNLTLRFERDAENRIARFGYSTFRCRHILYERLPE